MSSTTHTNRMVDCMLFGDRTYLSNVNESAHQVLVAERADGLLCLFSRCVLHNPATVSICTSLERCMGLTRIPTRPAGRIPNPSIQHPSTKKQNRETQPSHVGAHLRHSIRKQQHIGKKNLPRCSSSDILCHKKAQSQMFHTLSHEIF